MIYLFSKIYTIKKFLVILFFSCCLLPVGMTQVDTSNIHKEQLEVIENDVVALARYLTDSVESDLEKVTNIYEWLIKNISYDHQAYRNGNKRINRSNADILERKEAICWGYSTLFKAMCDEVNIPCEVISGYGKTAFGKVPKLKSPNHAWNAVKIDTTWYLLDATWDSGTIGNVSLFEQKYGQNYFLTSPKYFIVNHLPADPDWQLLDCPISPEEYKLSEDTIVILAEKKGCESSSALLKFESLAIHDKRLVTAIKAYKYNRTKLNARELAHAQLDYEAHLTEIAERLQQAEKYDSLLLVQAEMIRLCETAEQLTKLFDTQLENCAYNFFNYAVALTQVTDSKTSSLDNWQDVFNYLKQAEDRLKKLPQNMFTQNALTLCKDYLEYAQENIDALK